MFFVMLILNYLFCLVFIFFFINFFIVGILVGVYLSWFNLFGVSYLICRCFVNWGLFDFK